MKLEIGPGAERLDGFHTLDCVAGAGVDFVAIWGSEELPLLSDVCELVYASHVLEHVPWFQTVDALKEVLRILKPGGDLVIWVPDFRWLVQCYQEHRCGDDWRRHNPEDDPMMWLNGRLFTYGPDPNWHRAIFDEWHLKRCFEKAGFVSVRQLPSGGELGHKHGRLSLGMTGKKP